MRFLRLGPAGMRGPVAVALTPRLAQDFSSALATWSDGGRIVVGCDTRISSEMLRRAALSALVGGGCEALDAGVISAPELHFLVPRLNAAGGLLIGAGHHPKGWNALAPLGPDGAFFTGEPLQELLDIYHSRRFDQRAWNRIGAVRPVPEAERRAYLDALSARLDIAAIAGRRFTVIADFCNGSGSRLADALAERWGVRLTAINRELTGILPHDPEPRPRSAVQVQSLLRPLGADIGLVFNSDMSRAAIVTSRGETLSEEYTVALVADQLLARRPGQRVVTNWCTTRTLDEVAARHGAVVEKTRVGEAFIVARLRETGAELAGDGSGGAAFGGHLPGYDNFMVLGVLLEAMARGGATSAELAERLPRYHIVKKSVALSSAQAYPLLRRLAEDFPDARASEEDGLRLDWPDGWMHVRASMTEPIVRMIVEWSTREGAEERALQLRGRLERRLAS